MRVKSLSFALILLATNVYSGDKVYIDWDSFDHVQSTEGYLDYIHGYNSYTLFPNSIKAMFVNPIPEPIKTPTGKSYRAALDIKDGNQIYRLNEFLIDTKMNDSPFLPELMPIYYDKNISTYIVRYYRLIGGNYKLQQYVYIYNKKKHITIYSPVIDVRTGETVFDKKINLTGSIEKIGNDTYKYYVDVPKYKELKNGLNKEISSIDIFYFTIKYEPKSEYGFTIKDCIKGFACDGEVSGGNYITPMKLSDEVSYE